jgi:hypothetical protein
MELNKYSSYAIFSKNGTVDVIELNDEFTIVQACEKAKMMHIYEFKYLTAELSNGERDMYTFDSNGREI